MLTNHIECNNLYMTLLVHKYISRNNFSYYTYQTSVYCTICCLLIVKQWQKCQNSIYTSSSAIQVLPSDMENTLTHILLLLLQLLFIFIVLWKNAVFMHCNFFCQEYKFTYLLLNLNLIYETLWTGVRSGLLISVLEKLSWFRLTSLITMVLLM